MQSSDTMVLIPARGGSKGIPRKNLVDLCGKPLVWWTIQQAKAANVGPVVVSTDDEEIKRLAWHCGVKVRERPAEYATDEASTESVMLDVLHNRVFESSSLVWRPSTMPPYVIVLQPTSPLRRAYDIQAALRYVNDEQAQSLFSGTFSHACTWRREQSGLVPLWQGGDARQRKRRQDCLAEVTENGSIYIVNVEPFLRDGTRFCGRTATHIMESWTRFEVDSPEDLGLIRMILRHRLESGSDGITT